VREFAWYDGLLEALRREHPERDRRRA
jgi:hypothetical protein